MQNRSHPPRTGSSGRASGSAPRRTSAPPPRELARRSAPAGSARPYSANSPQHGRSGGSSRPDAPRSQRQVPAPPRGPSGNRRPASHRMPRRRPRISLFAFVVFACVAAVLAYIIHFISIVGIGTPKYVDNVYVNGMSFAGMTKEEAMAQVQSLENEWLSETYTLQYQNYSWTFTRAQVGADALYESPMEQAWNLGQIGSVFQRKARIQRLEKNPSYLNVAITYDESLLDSFIAEICAAIDTEPVDAVVVPDVSAPVVLQESRTGLAVNAGQLKEQLAALILTGEGDTAIPVDTLFPNVNSDAVSFQTIGYFTTDVSFRSSASRHNVRQALNAFNGLTVLPGQRISFNDVVGPRSEETGFREATEYAGDVATLGWGGGVCQASTTLYNALIMADMTIVDRKQHSMTVTYVDPSCDAAVVYGSDDLIFENGTDYPIYIYTSVTSDLATVTIYGHRPDYFYRLESVVIEEDMPSTRVVYIDDADGDVVYYKDEPPVVQSPGRSGCYTQGWVVAYDWETQQEVSRVQVSSDHYRPGATVFYRGVHDRNQVGIITDY